MVLFWEAEDRNSVLRICVYSELKAADQRDECLLHMVIGLFTVYGLKTGSKV